MPEGTDPICIMGADAAPVAMEPAAGASVAALIACAGDALLDGAEPGPRKKPPADENENVDVAAVALPALGNGDASDASIPAGAPPALAAVALAVVRLA